jgi:hypothetical protein
MRVPYRHLVGLAVGFAALTYAVPRYRFPYESPYVEIVAVSPKSPGGAVFVQVVGALYWLMWLANPYLLVYHVWSAVERKLHGPAGEASGSGKLPVYEDPAERSSLYVTIGEQHDPVNEGPSREPRWMTIPEKGLYTGTLAIGAIGSGKSSGVLAPMMDQLLLSPKKIGGLILDPNGDLQRHAAKTLAKTRRELINIAPDGYCWNPLVGGFDVHDMSLNIAGIISNLHGESREPYWRQSYTMAMGAFLRINMLTRKYVTFADLYLCLMDSREVTQRIAECRKILGRARYVVMSKEAFEGASKSYKQTLRHTYKFSWSDEYKAYRATWSLALQGYLRGSATKEPRFKPQDYTLNVYEQTGLSTRDSEQLDRFEFWWAHDWQARDETNRMNVATSVEAFLYEMYDDDDVRNLLCPPMEAYEAGWTGRPVLASMDTLLDSGTVAAVTVPLNWAAGKSRTLNVLAKLQFQFAVASRMVPDDEDIRPAMLVMDELPAYMTTGEGSTSTVGDEAFLAKNTRRGRCIVIAAAQEIRQIKPIIGLFQNHIYLACEPESSQYASQKCGNQWVLKESLSLSETNQDIHRVAFDRRLMSRKGGTGLSRTWSPHRVPVFEPEVIARLSTNEAVCCLFDGRQRLAPSRVYLRPSYVDEQHPEMKHSTYFERQAAGVL